MEIPERANAKRRVGGGFATLGKEGKREMGGGGKIFPSKGEREYQEEKSETGEGDGFPKGKAEGRWRRMGYLSGKRKKRKGREIEGEAHGLLDIKKTSQ